jgi:hypothetical protein
MDDDTLNLLKTVCAAGRARPAFNCNSNERLDHLVSAGTSGTSLRRIASDLINRGFRTRRGSPWRLESIARVVAAERRSCSA